MAYAVPAKPADLISIHGYYLKGNQVEVSLHFNGKPPKPAAFMMGQPATFVMDLPNVQNKMQESNRTLSLGLVKSYQTITTDQKTRVVFQLFQSSNYSLQIKSDRIYIIFSQASLPLVPTQKANYRSAPATRSLVANFIKDIDFHRAQNGGGDFVIALQHADADVDVKPQGKQIVVNFPNTAISSFWERKIDVADFDTPVQDILVSAQGKNVQMIMNINGAYQQTNYESKNHFIINVVPITQAPINAKKVKTYTGKTLSLNFQNISVRSALQLLAQFAGINIVISDSVAGNVTLNVKNIPWDEAMDILLQTRNLGEYKIGDVTLIAPQDEIAAQERQQLSAQQQISGLEPLRSELVQVNYGKAADIAALLKSQNSTILSSRGSVSVDNRTNTLWLLDTPAKLAEVKDLIQKLDIPVRQVLIEARIVNVDTSFSQELGIRWGFTKPNNFTGTLNGASQMANGTAPSAVPFNQRLNVDLPATAINSAQPASIGLALATLGNNVMLDLELSALESEGDGKIIASPRLITANQKEASIEAGEEIPYQEATSSGATSIAFKKAVLSLKVTPQITPDNRLILNLKVNQDKRGSPEVQNVPPIDTRELETQVLVDNGQTIVLGGIFQRDSSNQVERIPFLGSLPLIGALFKHTTEKTKQTELLIFITPKIIKQSQFAQ